MKSPPKFRRIFKDQLADYITAIAWSTEGSIFAASAAGELVQWQQNGTHWNKSAITTRNNQSLISSPQDQSEGTPSTSLSSSSPLTNSSLNCLGLSSDSRFLAVGGQAGTLWVWDMQADKKDTLHTHDFGSVWLDQLAWHPTQPILAVGVGRQVYLWKIPGSDPFRVYEFESSTVLSLAWHPSGEYLAVGGHHGVKVWNIYQQTDPVVLEVPGASLCTAWSFDGKFLASGNLDRTISVMDFRQPPPWLMQGFPGKVSHITWMQSSQPMLVAASSDGITVWSPTTDQSWKNTVLTGHQSSIQAIASQPNGNLLASAGDEQHIRLWNNGKKLQQTVKGGPEGTHCLAWNHTGQQLALGGSDGTILIFEVTNEAK